MVSVFDLTGIHDVKTMAIRWALDEVDPVLSPYGEGWDMGNRFCTYDKAKKDNAYQMPNIGFFNDDQRDAIKGEKFMVQSSQDLSVVQCHEPIVAKGYSWAESWALFESKTRFSTMLKPNMQLQSSVRDLPSSDQSSDQIMRKVETATAMNLSCKECPLWKLAKNGRTKLISTGEHGQLTPADRERAMNS